LVNDDSVGEGKQPRIYPRLSDENGGIQVTANVEITSRETLARPSSVRFVKQPLSVTIRASLPLSVPAKGDQPSVAS